MEIKVKVYINGEQISHEELHRYEVRCPAVDRIVNDIIRRYAPDRDAEKNTKNEEPAISK